MHRFRERRTPRPVTDLFGQSAQFIRFGGIVVELDRRSAQTRRRRVEADFRETKSSDRTGHDINEPHEPTRASCVTLRESARISDGTAIRTRRDHAGSSDDDSRTARRVLDGRGFA
jgi:hypothetical protein